MRSIWRSAATRWRATSRRAARRRALYQPPPPISPSTATAPIVRGECNQMPAPRPANAATVTPPRTAGSGRRRHPARGFLPAPLGPSPYGLAGQEALQVAGQHVGAGVRWAASLCRHFRQIVCKSRQAGLQALRGKRLVVDHLAERLHEGGPAKDRPAGEHLVEDAPRA